MKISKKRKNQCIVVSIFIILYLFIPTFVTLNMTGTIDTLVPREDIDGRSIIVEYKNATQSVSVEKFITMVMAARFDISREVEVLKAESIMIRTDILRIMGDNLTIDSKDLGMEYYTTSIMRSKWKDDFNDNYELIKDCTSSTYGLAIKYQGKFIDARYTEVSGGTTLSGNDVLGEGHEYMIPVECEKDKESTDYVAVKTISNKEFAAAFEKNFDGLTMDKSNLENQVQIAARSTEGYVQKIQVGNVVMTGNTFAQILGINSPNFKLSFMDSGVKVNTVGVGEGMGMSMYTADYMAKNGAGYEEILKTFYNDISILCE
ncbi:MAG: SpoIID/LytB domain-containing protein [Eubacteriales bacterium]|nr:SpoIID/LytB domain-containing protein [Eubacteriales bacterium]